MSGSMMGGIDASIPLQAGRGVPAPVNPLDSLGRFAEIQNALNSAKLNPGALQIQAQSIQTGQLSLAERQKQAAWAHLAPLLAEQQITHSMTTGGFASAEHNGIITAPALSDLTGLPAGDGPAYDRMVRARIMAYAQPPENRAAAVTPETRLANTGRELIGFTTPARGMPGQGNIQRGAGSVGMALSPGELAAQQTPRPATEEEARALGVPPGTPITETLMQRLQSQGMGGLVGGAPAPRPAGSYLDGINGTEGTGRNPRSSADGAFGQFTRDTWLSYARANPGPFQGMNEQQILAMRSDPSRGRQLGQHATLWLAGQNAPVLARAGLDPNNGQALALAHLLGAEPAVAILKAPLGMPVRDALAKVLSPTKVEEYLTANPTWANMTAGKLAESRAGVPNLTGAPQTATPVATPSAQGPRPTVAGFAPGETDAMKVDTERYKTDQAGIPDRQTSVQTLGKALHALDLTGSGKGAETLYQMRSFLSTLTPEWANALGFKPWEISTMNYDLAHKYMTDYARGIATGGTDQARAMAAASNASTSISPEAARDVLKTNVGRERQRIAQVMDAPDSTSGKGYGSHAAKFATDTDPRAFAFDHYSPAERKALLASMSKSERKRFDRSLEVADKHGLLDVPDAK